MNFTFKAIRLFCRSFHLQHRRSSIIALLLFLTQTISVLCLARQTESRWKSALVRLLTPLCLYKAGAFAKARHDFVKCWWKIFMPLLIMFWDILKLFLSSCKIRVAKDPSCLWSSENNDHFYTMKCFETYEVMIFFNPFFQAITQLAELIF